MPRAPITLSFWQLGINSLLPPTEIAKQQYAWGENIINRGGIIQTRPGRRPIASLLGSNPQGICIFKPTASTARILAAVDGSVYVMQYPAYVPVKLEGISFNPKAEKVHFCVAIKSSQRNEDESLKIIDPTPVVVMQDGESRAAFWDGTTARHLDPSSVARETPIGSWMAWVGSRLWIASGSKIYASDLADPLSHFEAQYLSGRDAFELSGECTGLIPTSNRAGLLAFTETTTTAFKSNERDRTKWGTTEGFQDEIIQNVGCVAGRTACNQYGLTHWLSDKGLVNLDVALASVRSSKLVTEDENMMRSRRKLAPGIGVACAMPYENLLFVSVPSGSRYNEQTWVMDQAPISSATPGAGVWASVWTGTRPVQWTSGNIGGRKRIFNLSYDKSVKDDTRIHVWEEMLSERTDSGGRIKCQWQTGVASGEELMRFNFARMELMEILGNVDLKVLVAGTRGPWYEVGDYRLQAEEGCFGSSKQPVITSESIIQEFKPQSRSLRTREFNTEEVATPEQKPYNPGIDKGFMLCFEWTGRMGIREICMIFGDGPKELHGTPACLENGETGEAGQENAINEQGQTV